jgi:hypothetical protein
VLAETYVVVRNYTPEPTTENGRRGLEALDSRRVHYVNLLARNAVPRDVVERAGAPASIFNTLTIIPTLTFCDIPRLPEKSKKRLFERLHLPGDVSPTDFAHALKTRMQTLLPSRCHQWSPEVADVASLYDAGREAAKQNAIAEAARRKAIRIEQEKARKEGRNYSEADWLDDAIPFEIERPKISYGPPPPLPLAPTVRTPEWKPSPPIIRSPRPPKPTPRFRKPAFLTAWKTAA